MGVVGLRDLFLVAPFNHSQRQPQQDPMMSDHQAAASTVNASNSATARGVGVIPLLTAQFLAQPGVDLGGGPELLHNARASHNGTNRDNIGNGSGSGSGNGIDQLWQSQFQHPYSYSKKPGMFDHHINSMNLLQTAVGRGGPVLSGQMSAVATCEDCGNQAKKDCTHRRCRTCCRNRGYDCSTHVKSTWVPAARRRERRAGCSSASTSSAKKPRLAGTSQTTATSHTSNSNNTPPRSFDASSSHRDAGVKETLPAHVRAPAVFKCVRLTTEEGENDFAYQAVVKIGGRVFKGLLYDQGVPARGGDDDDHYPNVSELHLGGGGGRRNSGTPSPSPMLDAAADVFAASAGASLGGSGVGYGNQMN